MEETTVHTTPEEGFADTQAEADSWDDIDLSGLKDDGEEETWHEDAKPEETSEEADQQPEEPEGEEEIPASEEDQTEEQAEADQSLFELKHLGETKQVSREEVVRLAQKGMDYDRIRSERDADKAEIKRLQEMESFLTELAAPSGISVSDLMDQTRAQLLAEREGLDPAVAAQRVKLERERKAFEEKKAQEEQTQREQAEANRRRQEDFLRFKREYPHVDPKNIPQEVWDKVREGGSLMDAYSRHENKQLRDEVEAWKKKAETAEQNHKNKERSTGSQRSAGQTSEQDAFDRAWYDGT